MILTLVKAFHAPHKCIDESVYLQYNKGNLVFLPLDGILHIWEYTQSNKALASSKLPSCVVIF